MKLSAKSVGGRTQAPLKVHVSVNLALLGTGAPRADGQLASAARSASERHR